ncbi:HlyD family efflux transporter periplasmic adaptor subunit [Pseudoalteromonas sp. SR44-5]|uniref:efflux RND transporter periplasmic adaptor subunit n=1 Tax=unclassified Pseudoalteromonas TaxID=194690 RepID=UPI0016032243|nr:MULTISPECIES: HlyD family efflux transporter periplasmic adaptor subunit [unclassified Pseudoalteromonas]MBB1332306.1 HlyD family efflux transporter periplasmic adaptor subunit [Pseudoalteromonas sp. SR41-6]MBB1365643.1 HlyD family efflux transporter periplasmic adaptor subunit [Pseudoalteromonas sp. SR44-5]MBB1457564.1 HlyD family efflux transporter periplasmic adaptor subunit [Pseudoalteromonas sp. SG41-8]
MDIDSTLKRSTKPSQRKKLIFGTLLISIALIIWLIYSWLAPTALAANQLQIATVTQADFVIKIRGFGRLKSKYQRYLTNTDSAMVEAIHVYPGTRVNKDTVILTLVNPLQAQRLSVARLELARQKASANEQIINQKSQRLERQASLTILKSELESAQLRAQAESKLIEQGIVSSLDYKRSLLTVKQLEQRVDIEKQRLVQLADMHHQRSKIQQELLSQFELNYQVQQQAFDDLQVTAGIDGMLQELNVELGQNLTPGTRLAIVGSDTALKAELSVQQSDAEKIALNMPARVNTFSTGNRGEVIATVTRIDPIVSDGRVMIELDLTGSLPANARPDLSIEGYVISHVIPNALTVNLPTKVQADTDATLFKLNPTTHLAHLTQIEFGTLSDNKIQLLSGAKVGEQLIISDLSKWQHLATIKIEQESL